jgi:hypothetical protein
MTWIDWIITVACVAGMFTGATLSLAYIAAALHPRATWPQTRRYAAYAGLYAAPVVACLAVLLSVTRR